VSRLVGSEMCIRDSDYLDRFIEAIGELFPLVLDGSITYAVEVVEGLENAPATLNRLFTGEHTGKLLVKVSDAAD
jgi:NADPH-dependent curcumin reductase CurA